MTNHTDRQIAVRLGLIFFVLSLLIFGGHLYTGDGEAYFTVALKLLTFQDPTIPAFLKGYAATGPGGGLYAKFGIGLSILVMPFTGICLLLGGLWPGLVLGGGQLRAAALLVGPVMGSLGLLALYWFQRERGISRRGAVVSGLFCAFGGLLLVYSRFLLPELPLATFFLLAVWGLYREGETGDWLIGTSSAFTLLLRYDAAVFVGPIVLYRLYQRRRFFPIVSPLAVSFLLMGLYNLTRFGHVMAVGMGASSVETFSTPVLLGLYGQFFAVGNGLFVYAPYLGIIAGYLIVNCLRHRDTGDRALVVLCGSVLFILLHSMWYSWMGGWSWGPRRMVPLLLVAHVPMGFLWDDLEWTSKYFLYFFGMVSSLVNLPGMITDFNHYYQFSFYQRDVLFSVKHSQLFQQALGLFHGKYPVDVFWFWMFGGWVWACVLLASLVGLIVLNPASVINEY